MFRPTPVIVVTWLLAAASSEAAEPLIYRLTYPGETPDHVAVSIEVPVGSSVGDFLMPRAVPMGYAEYPYADFVSGVSAIARDGERLEVERGPGPRWRIGSGEPAELATLTYEVDLRSMEREILDSSAASKVRERWVGLLGYSVFGYLEGTEERPVRLALESPEGWPLFSTLAPETEAATGRLTTEAADFYALADSQVTMGPGLDLLRVGSSPSLFVVGFAEAPWDIELTGELGRQALDALVSYFGSSPFEHFTMVVEVLRPLSDQHEYGFSMEHLDSATFFLGSERVLTSDSSEVDRRRHLYNYAHHMAHAWIPKRCAGRGYFPFDWEFAPVLDSIWFSEGFGQYVAGVALAEQADAEQTENGDEYLERLLDFRFRRSLAEAPESIRRMPTVDLSRVASTRYGSDFRLGRSVFSRGALMAAEMDTFIRQRTEGEKSLRDGLRHLLATVCKAGPTFPAEELPRLLEEATGVDVRAIYESWMAAPSGAE